MFQTSGLHIDQAPPLHVPFRFFGTAPLFLLAAGVALVTAGTELTITPLHPATIAVAHLLVLGWISLVIVGSLYQMIPVLAGVRVPGWGLVKVIHPLLAGGTATLAAGAWFDHPGWLLAGGAATLTAFLLFLPQIGIALHRAPTRHPAVVSMMISAASLAGTILLGALFAWEYRFGFLEFDRAALVGIHLTWGLVGWIGVLIIGVSFQVLPMFYMMPLFPEPAANRILAGVGATLLTLPGALWLLPDSPLALGIAALPGVAGVALYAVNMTRLFAQRKRKTADATYRFWQTGFATGVAALLALAAWPLSDAVELRFLFGVCYLIGWVSSITIGMLYRIIPFLVWFHRFSRFAGFVEIPMMDDLVPERWIRFHWYWHLATLAALVVGVVGGSGGLELGGVGLIGSAGILWYGLWSALRHPVPPPEALPDFSAWFKEMPPPAN